MEEVISEEELDEYFGEMYETHRREQDKLKRQLAAWNSLVGEVGDAQNAIFIMHGFDESAYGENDLAYQRYLNKPLSKAT